MGRMLKALQQVGTTPRSGQWQGPVSRQELKSFGLWRPAEPRCGDPDQTQDAGETQATQSAAGDSPIALLHTVEETIAAELNGGNGPRPQQSDSFFCGPASSQQSGYPELAERILAQTPSRSSAVMVFAGVDEQGPVAAVTAELATAVAARVSGEVLLIDADFHRPRLAGWFGVDAERSLADVFLGVAHWEHAVRRTAISRLSLLPGGFWPTDRQPPEDLQPGRLLSQIQQSYCMVLVHTGTATSPATDWLGRYTDGIHLVVELGRTPRRGARRVVSRLNRCGLRVLGCIVADTATRAF